jgi:transposase
VKRNELHTFKVLPKRWIVERTFGWLTHWRIMNRHHERTYDTAENIMRVAMTKNMPRYLAMSDSKDSAA